MENYSRDNCSEFLEHPSDKILTRSPSLSSNESVVDNPTKMCHEDTYEKTDESLAINGERQDSDFEIVPDSNSSSSSSSSNSTVKYSDLPESLNPHEHTNNKNLSVPISCNVANVLIISDPKEHEKKTKIINVDIENATVANPSEKKPKKVARVKSKPAPPPSPPVKLNRDECDWDSLFDDNGECLDPTLIEEVSIFHFSKSSFTIFSSIYSFSFSRPQLTAAVGEVTIEQPKNDYKAFSRPVEVSSDEFAHVIEIYNFPSDFKTCDLAAVFSPWKNGGFELKWVDDTHCLGVFSSPLVGKL